MNGAQDLGGMMGFGPVRWEKNEPVFHGAWEKRALAVTLACNALGEWTGDRNRFERETLHPAFYLSKSYYEIWIAALEKNLARKGLVSPQEIDAGEALTPRRDTKSFLRGADVDGVLARGTPYMREAKAPAQFKEGDLVRTINDHPATHTRLPRFARGKTGRVERVRGVFVFPDSNAHDQGEDPHWCYTVAFSARELWGATADPKHTVTIDAWEPYLRLA